ncbi:tripartite tricarboxylate transporter TctB family protein [Sutcliffiella horikoshii]|uniref:tripartite tricarboxylate transporter TctB family protein n=1 Tax=Sutcliffiella horikoshii TaxID=79883 RepID=UPI001CBD050E|nr:tripartite tricarboxylate transporter TctB family protein [Sutcliffiella horikoshii]UAL49344.1 tripartite tricarboxylate transporter TctB family protein [Sutcliffiella horikoshii]
MILRPINRKLGLALFFFAGVYLFLSYQIPSYTYALVDADVVPKGLGFLLLILSILLFVQKKEETEQEKEKRTIPKKELYVLLGVAGFILIYIFLLEIVGFVIMTATFVFTCSSFLGYKKYKVSVLVAIIFSLLLYFLFNYLLLIHLPPGVLPF